MSRGVPPARKGVSSYFQTDMEGPAVNREGAGRDDRADHPRDPENNPEWHRGRGGGEPNRIRWPSAPTPNILRRPSSHSPLERFRRPSVAMHLREFFTPERVDLHLDGGSRDEVLEALIGLLVWTTARAPSCRERCAGGEPGIDRHRPGDRDPSLPLARGDATAHGVWAASGRCGLRIDRRSPRAPLLSDRGSAAEVSGRYLPLLGKVAQFAKEADVPGRLAVLGSPAEFFDLLDSKGV